MIYAVAMLAPLVGGSVAGLFGRLMGDRAAQLVTIGCMAVSAACGVGNFVWLWAAGSPSLLVPLGDWIDAGSFHAAWALRDDMLAAVLVGMVSAVSFLIHVYSVGYMADETRPSYRFFSYISLFTFAMLILSQSDNIVQLFFGWEGVGLMSYLLIGYWYDRTPANDAAIKAFVVNRVSDLFFAVGIALLFYEFGSVDYGTIFAAIPAHLADTYDLLGMRVHAIGLIALLLFIGAMGKSAQFLFHTWLPDAMEGPTPISALIHAATMVTTGVFLVARMSPLFDATPAVLHLIAVIGAITCFFAATVGCVQTDIKRVIAYSTCSQLGYMFIAAGLGLWQAAIFHLVMHAFFKSLLFLCAGSVIHAMEAEQDMRKMGGLWRHLPVTYWTMWAGGLALAAIPPFAGFWSKDAILHGGWAAGGFYGQFGYWLGTVAAGLTAFYTARMMVITFHGKPRMPEKVLAHVHDTPWTMRGPQLVLSIGAVFGGMGFIAWFIGADQAGFWNGSVVDGPYPNLIRRLFQIGFVPDWLPTLFALAGFAAVYTMYVAVPTLPARMASAFRPGYLFLVHKWYFDEIYDAIFVRPYRALARALRDVDETVIDGMPTGVASLAAEGSRGVLRVQTGSLAVYAFGMLIGLVLLIAVFLLFR